MLAGLDHCAGHLRRLADLTILDQEPAEAGDDTLRDLNPIHTIVDGRYVAG
jgi:predicted amidohydrolase YtcJ